jgi:hypothetical protein
MDILNVLLGLNRNEMRLPNEGELYEHDVGGIETAPPMGFNLTDYRRFVGPYMKEAADRLGFGDLGDYVNSFIGKNAYHAPDKSRGERFLDRIAGRLGYRVEYVPGESIDAKGNLGTTYFGNNDFDDKVIYIAGGLSDAEREYVAMHESFEAMEKAKNPGYNPEDTGQHNALERKVLNYMKEQGYGRAYKTALDMHMRRYGGSNSRIFAGMQDEIYRRVVELNDTKGIYKTDSLDELFAAPKNYVTGKVRGLIENWGSN